MYRQGTVIVMRGKQILSTRQNTCPSTEPDSCRLPTASRILTARGNRQAASSGKRTFESKRWLAILLNSPRLWQRLLGASPSDSPHGLGQQLPNQPISKKSVHGTYILFKVYSFKMLYWKFPLGFIYGIRH